MNDLNINSKNPRVNEQWSRCNNRLRSILAIAGFLSSSLGHSEPQKIQDTSNKAVTTLSESSSDLPTSQQEITDSATPPAADTNQKTSQNSKKSREESTTADKPSTTQNSATDPERSASNGNKASAVNTPVVVGPEKPIGHSLKTPEAQRRIEFMMANAQQKVGPLVAGQDTAKSTAPLVGGRYGFSVTGEFTGVPKALVSLGSSSPAYGIIVEKLHHRMTLFRLTEKGSYEKVKSYRAITGRDPGDKIFRGDLRTPEGIYFVTGRLSDDELPPKYGRMAFTLDYPNIYDKRQRKSGYGIWIHATDDANRLQKPFDTEGCVVVSNEDILELQQYITSFEVPVVITKEMTSVDESELAPTRRKALEMVEAWRRAWESSSFETYMSYYSKNFRSLGKNKDQWQSFKVQLSDERGAEIQVKTSEPKIVAFEDQLLVVFLQDYASKQHTDFGRKFLYLQWEGDRYRIIAEKWYRTPRTETALRMLKTPAKQF